MPARSRVEVCVIGAGMAGLAAARWLVEHGHEVEILEATDRVGGRAHTWYAGHEAFPVELGPEFVHGKPGVTNELVREAGLALDGLRDTHFLHRGGQLVHGGDVWERFGELLARADRDESARAYSDRTRMSPDDADLFAHFVEGFYGASLDDISITSIAGDASGLGGSDAKQARIHGGYGRLVDWLSARLLAGNVYFAGEATDSDYEGTVAGALASGIRAACALHDAAGMLAGRSAVLGA